MLFARAIFVLAANWDDMFSGSPCLMKTLAKTPPELLCLLNAMTTGGEPEQFRKICVGVYK